MKAAVFSLLALTALTCALPNPLPKYPPYRYPAEDENPLLADRTAPSAPSSTANPHVPLHTTALMAGVAATRVLDDKRPLHTIELMAMASDLRSSPTTAPGQQHKVDL